MNRISSTLSSHPSLLGWVSPRHRRWWKILESLDLDPDRDASANASPGTHDFMICGIPRSGTSLLTAALYQPPECVTVMEPWDGMRLPPVELFSSIRAELKSGELSRGRLDVESLVSRGEVQWGSDGDFPHRVETLPEYFLGVKWTVYWRYLDKLPRTKFLVCVRDPLDVVASFASMKGRLSEGLDYDIPFNRDMNESLIAATQNLPIRRALLYEYIAARILPHLDSPNVLLVQYERWFTDRRGLMRDIAGFLDADIDLGSPVIREPAPRPIDHGLTQVVSELCPSARGLGYDVLSADRIPGTRT